MFEKETRDWDVRVELDAVGEQFLERLAPEPLDGDERTVAQEPEHNVRVVLVDPAEDEDNEQSTRLWNTRFIIESYKYCTCTRNCTSARRSIYRYNLY